MARRRFFVDEIRRGMAELTGDDAEHLVRVLRVQAGQVFEISDNQRAYIATVITARKSLVEFEVRVALPAPESSPTVVLCPALFKFDAFEGLVEKATELGVTTIQPVIAARSEKGLDRAAAKRIERWRRIALEASQQSRRLHLPTIEPAVPLRQVIARAERVRLLLDEEGGEPVLTALPKALEPTTSIALLTGPEGGWTPEERNAAQQAGWRSCTLGSTVLRAETAGVAALATVQAAWLRR